MIAIQIQQPRATQSIYSQLEALNIRPISVGINPEKCLELIPQGIAQRELKNPQKCHSVSGKTQKGGEIQPTNLLSQFSPIIEKGQKQHSSLIPKQRFLLSDKTKIMKIKTSKGGIPLLN